jgi:excisionase family DNA binding protein
MREDQKQEVPIWHKALLRVDEVAQLMSISPEKVHQLINQRSGLPYLKLGPRCWRISRADLDEWIRKQEREGA